MVSTRHKRPIPQEYGVAFDAVKSSRLYYSDFGSKAPHQRLVLARGFQLDNAFDVIVAIPPRPCGIGALRRYHKARPVRTGDNVAS